VKISALFHVFFNKLWVIFNALGRRFQVNFLNLFMKTLRLNPICFFL